VFFGCDANATFEGQLAATFLKKVFCLPAQRLLPVALHIVQSVQLYTTTMKKCRVVLCGVGGNMGKIRTRLVFGNPRFEIRGVCDVDYEAAQQMADLYSVRFFLFIFAFHETYVDGCDGLFLALAR
jgi:hypothetical protein